MRTAITLACTECKQRNYRTNKNKKNNPDRLELKNIARSAKKKHYIKKRNNSPTVRTCLLVFEM